MLRSLLLVVGFAIFTEAKNLPSYVKPCKRNGPEFKKCVKEHAINAIPYIIKGDKEYQVPALDPLTIPEISIDGGSQLKIVLKEVILKGLSGIRLEDIDADLEKRHATAKFSLKSVTIDAQYNIDGRILLVPLTGKGPIHLDCEDLIVDYTFDFNLKTKNGKEYFDPDISPKVTYTLQKVNLNLENLFNGDKELGDRTNQFLNEHALEINNDFSDTFAQAINAVATDIIKRIFPLVPFDEVFL